MKKLLTSIFSMMMATLMLISCTEENVAPKSTTENVINLGARLREDACGSNSWTIWAGQTINAGTLTVENNATTLFVTYTGNEGVCFQTLHLWVGSDMTTIPMAGNGAPIPGKFPYSFNAAGSNSYTFEIPLSSIAGWNGCGQTTFNVVAHAEVDMNCDGSSDETGFGGDKSGTGPRWWFYASYGVACCELPPPPPSEKYGTAFAYGTHVFTTDSKSNPDRLPTLGLTKNRWGWAINRTSTGTTNHTLWVGAGLNSTRKALNVGYVTVSYTGGYATVTYNLAAPFTIEEAHVYVNDFRPTTIAPGQYGNTSYFNPLASLHSVTVEVSDSNGDGIWVIAHAVAFGPKVTNP